LNSSGYTPECREHLAVIACIFKYLTYTSVWSAKPALILDKKFLKKGSQKLVIPNNSRAKIYKKNLFAQSSIKNISGNAKIMSILEEQLNKKLSWPVNTDAYK